MQETIYSVSQAVKLVSVQSHVLRYWEEEMKLPIGRNEMGHRYYTRWDIQVFLSIKELKKRGYSLKEIGELAPLFYKEQVETKRDTIPREFMEIISKIVIQRLQKTNAEEARYKRLDERIRNCQQFRRETAAAAEKNNQKRKHILKKITE